MTAVGTEPVPSPASKAFPTMDPELAELLSELPQIDFADLAAARTVLAALSARVLSTADHRNLELTQLSVPADGPEPSVLMRIVAPHGAAKDRPALLWIHGGGFALGSAAAEMPFCEELAERLDIVVAAVDYRLAPETPYPGPLQDCYRSLLFLHRHADRLGIDPARIAVGGNSAGGGLAAALTLLARDRGEVSVAFQALESPELDDRLQSASMLEFTETPVWSLSNARLSWSRYLGPDYQGPDDPRVTPYAAPGRATDHAGLPPAYLSTMELDPLRDEGISYALSLLRAGVSVELHSFPGTFHRSTILTAAAVSGRAREEFLAAIGRGLTAVSTDA